MSFKAHVVSGTLGWSAYFCNIQLIYCGDLLITIKMWLERGRKQSGATAKNFLFYTELFFLISPSQNPLIRLSYIFEPQLNARHSHHSYFQEEVAGESVYAIKKMCVLNKEWL